jgi:hypothetical protein
VRSLTDNLVRRSWSSARPSLLRNAIGLSTGAELSSLNGQIFSPDRILGVMLLGVPRKAWLGWACGLVARLYLRPNAKGATQPFVDGVSVRPLFSQRYGSVAEWLPDRLD